MRAMVVFSRSGLGLRHRSAVVRGLFPARGAWRRLPRSGEQTVAHITGARRAERCANCRGVFRPHRA
jgi:hypothetical protein